MRRARWWCQVVPESSARESRCLVEFGLPDFRGKGSRSTLQRPDAPPPGGAPGTLFHYWLHCFLRIQIKGHGSKQGLIFARNFFDNVAVQYIACPPETESVHPNRNRGDVSKNLWCTMHQRLAHMSCLRLKRDCTKTDLKMP